MPAGTAAVGTTKPAATALPGAVTTPTAAAGCGSNSGTLLVILCVVLLVIGAALAYVFLLRNRKGGNPLAGVFSGGETRSSPGAAGRIPGSRY